MIRLTWRQARPNILSCAILLTLLVATAVLVERSMSDFIDKSGLAACVAADGQCSILRGQFHNKYQAFLGFYPWLNFVPMFLGAFWGGPLIAREIELGTHRLVWSQSVTRRRWLATKLGMFLLGATVAAAIMTWVMTFWLHPLQKVGDDYVRLAPDVYDFVGLVPVAYTLFAFAIGAAAGAVVKRVVPAMAITVPVYLALRLWFESIRGEVFAPIATSAPFSAPKGHLPPAGSWVVNNDLVDGAGNAVGFAAKVPQECQPGSGSGSAACAPFEGWHFVSTYQPPTRFWPLQLIESGVFTGAAVLCLALAVWWTLRKTS